MSLIGKDKKSSNNTVQPATYSPNLPTSTYHDRKFFSGETKHSQYTPALRHVEHSLGISGRKPFGELVFTVKQVAEYFDVDEKTIKRYLESHGDELKKNGYEIRTGKQLQEAKSAQLEDINVPELDPRTPSLGVFSFRAFLNIGMLLTESENAKYIKNYTNII